MLAVLTLVCGVMGRAGGFCESLAMPPAPLATWAPNCTTAQAQPKLTCDTGASMS